jgi:hypothetical protein
VILKVLGGVYSTALIATHRVERFGEEQQVYRINTLNGPISSLVHYMVFDFAAYFHYV